MGRVKQKNTPAELTIRRIVYQCGFGFRTLGTDLPGSPDIVNRKHRWVIFVHGCFWHAHEGCGRARLPKKNREAWKKKFAANRERDRRALDNLERLGYRALTVWECELKNELALTRRLLAFLEQTRHYPEGETFSVLRGHRLIARRLVTGGSLSVTVYPLNVDVCEHDLRGTFYRNFLTSSSWPIWGADGSAVRVADVFSGCGGLSLGAREACSALGRTFQPMLAIDNDAQALAVYKANFTPRHAFAGDIEKAIDGKLGSPLTSREKRWKKIVGRIDVLLAGPPCQGHSDLNNHSRRDDPRNGLYRKVGRVAEVLQPEHILIENVPTVVHGRDAALDTTVDHLESLGYQVDCGVVDLRTLGVPQRRRRHVVVASGAKEIEIKAVVRRFRDTLRCVQWAIADLECEEKDDNFSRACRLSGENEERIRYLFEEDEYDLPNERRPPCHRNGHHSYKSMYGRLRWIEPAQTITSGFGSPGQGRYVHPSQRRTLTPHEAARLQLFPDSFKFFKAVHRTALARMIGNAVPMKLAYCFCVEFLAQPAVCEESPCAI